MKTKSERRIPPTGNWFSLWRPSDSADAVRGIIRSLRIYYGHPLHMRRMARFYAQLIGPDDLCFDVGAHVGSRVQAWTRLGARVVAVEPQPSCVQILRLLYGRDRRVRLVDQALGAASGQLTMRVCRREPPVSTLSADWMERVRNRPNFARVRWDAAVRVNVTTLDALIARFGEPAFCKIDVEGFELEVLRGLSRPLHSLSFEYVPGAIDMALACLERLAELGEYRYNVSPGESMELEFRDWVDARALAEWLSRLATDELPGDIYARLNPRTGGSVGDPPTST